MKRVSGELDRLVAEAAEDLDETRDGGRADPESGAP
jgi:hypothetical protein